MNKREDGVHVPLTPEAEALLSESEKASKAAGLTAHRVTYTIDAYSPEEAIRIARRMSREQYGAVTSKTVSMYRERPDGTLEAVEIPVLPEENN